MSIFEHTCQIQNSRECDPTRSDASEASYRCNFCGLRACGNCITRPYYQGVAGREIWPKLDRELVHICDHCSNIIERAFTLVDEQAREVIEFQRVGVYQKGSFTWTVTRASINATVQASNRYKGEPLTLFLEFDHSQPIGTVRLFQDEDRLLGRVTWVSDEMRDKTVNLHGTITFPIETPTQLTACNLVRFPLKPVDEMIP